MRFEFIKQKDIHEKIPFCKLGWMIMRFKLIKQNDKHDKISNLNYIKKYTIQHFRSMEKRELLHEGSMILHLGK